MFYGSIKMISSVSSMPPKETIKSRRMQKISENEEFNNFIAVCGKRLTELANEVLVMYETEMFYFKNLAVFEL